MESTGSDSAVCATHASDAGVCWFVWYKTDVDLTVLMPVTSLISLSTSNCVHCLVLATYWVFIAFIFVVAHMSRDLWPCLRAHVLKLRSFHAD